MKVYVVLSGSGYYGSMDIKGIFSTIELAKIELSKIMYDDKVIEEWELDGRYIREIE